MTEFGDGRPDDLCNGCGVCCDPVVLYTTQAEAAEASFPAGSDLEVNRRFIVDTLRQLSDEDGAMLTDWAPDTRAFIPVQGRGTAVIQATMYECPHYEYETGRCLNHADRPPLCRTYPRDGGRHTLLPPTCGYLLNQYKLPIPVPVEWRHRRVRSNA